MILIISNLILGTYAITLGLTESSGPYGILERLRNIKAIKDFGLLECSTCTSFWVALGLCVAFGRLDMYFVTAGGSIVLERLISGWIIK